MIQFCGNSDICTQFFEKHFFLNLRHKCFQNLESQPPKDVLKLGDRVHLGRSRLVVFIFIADALRLKLILIMLRNYVAVKISKVAFLCCSSTIMKPETSQCCTDNNFKQSNLESLSFYCRPLLAQENGSKNDSKWLQKETNFLEDFQCFVHLLRSKGNSTKIEYVRLEINLFHW